MDARVVFLCLLLVCLPLAGCVSNPDVIGEASASDDAVPSTASEPSSLSSNNHPPVISASISSGSVTNVEGSDCTTVGVQVEARHAMMDWDDNITQSGWDLNLDGVIDVPVTVREGYTLLQLNFSEMLMTTQPNPGNPNGEYTYAEASIVFGAQDASGVWSSSELLLVRKTTEYVYTSSNGEQTTYTYVDEEPCADFDDVRDYNFSLSDHADFASDGSTDYLVTISRTNGANGINWNRVRIYFDGSDEGNELCTATSRCQLLSGDGLQNTTSLGSMWEVGQSITIKEDGNNFHRAGYTAGVTIYIDNVVVFDEDIMLN